MMRYGAASKLHLKGLYSHTVTNYPDREFLLMIMEQLESWH